jgi:C4-dicarboxylate transporter DctQ subunit
LEKIGKILAFIEEFLVVGSIFITTFIVFFNVLMRNIFKFPLSWPDEIGRYLLIFIIFYGYIIAIRKDSEIKVDIVYKFFPSIKTYLSLISHVLSIIFSFILIALGTRYMLFKYRLGTKTVVTEFPYWILPLIFLVIGGGLMAYRYSEKIVEGYKKNKLDKL